MVTDADRENAVKAAQCAELLSSDVRALASSSDPLLGELGLEALEMVLSLEKRLKRLESLIRK